MNDLARFAHLLAEEIEKTWNPHQAITASRLCQCLKRTADRLSQPSKTFDEWWAGYCLDPSFGYPPDEKEDHMRQAFLAGTRVAADRLQQSPEEGWKMIQPGELRKDGDEWYSSTDRSWHRVLHKEIGVVFCDGDAPVRRFEKPEDPRLASLLSALERIAIAANIGVQGSSYERLSALCLISDTANKALAEQTTKTP